MKVSIAEADVTNWYIQNLMNLIPKHEVTSVLVYLELLGKPSISYPFIFLIISDGSPIKFRQLCILFVELQDQVVIKEFKLKLDNDIEIPMLDSRICI